MSPRTRASGKVPWLQGLNLLVNVQVGDSLPLVSPPEEARWLPAAMGEGARGLSKALLLSLDLSEHEGRGGGGVFQAGGGGRP